MPGIIINADRSVVAPGEPNLAAEAVTVTPLFLL
jgi:hypothetical protein